MGNLDTKPIAVSRDPLFRPFTVKTLNLKNRIVSSRPRSMNDSLDISLIDQDILAK